MTNTTAIGTRTEGRILAVLLEMGKQVLLPFGGGTRYDLAYDDGGKLVRVQCKTAVVRNGCISFNTRSNHRDGSSYSYDGDADLFGVYCPEIDSVYFVPVEGAAKDKGTLRIDKPEKNNNRIRWAADYKVA